MLNTGSFGQHGVLSRLATFLESRLKFTFTGGYNLNKDTTISKFTKPKALVTSADKFF